MGKGVQFGAGVHRRKCLSPPLLLLMRERLVCNICWLCYILKTSGATWSAKMDFLRCIPSYSDIPLIWLLNRSFLMTYLNLACNCPLNLAYPGFTAEALMGAGGQARPGQ